MHSPIPPVRDWPPNAASGSFPQPSPRGIGIASAGSTVKDRGPLLRLAPLVLDGGPGSGRGFHLRGLSCGKEPRHNLNAFGLCLPSPEPDSNWPRATFVNRTARGNGFVSSAANLH